jgi:LacI family transcriptional regulator
MVIGNKSARRVTLRDVGRVAGVSAMTVSRALRKDAHVSAATAMRICKIAREMKYQPDPHLTALAAYRKQLRPPKNQEVIAYLTTDSSREGYKRTRIGNESLRGACLRADEFGYRVEPTWLPDLIRQHHDPSDVLRARGIRGVILARMGRVGMTVDLDWDRFSCVAIGYSLLKPTLHVIASHFFHNLCRSFDELIAIGYKRPALLLSADLDFRTGHQFQGAFLYKQQSLPAACRLPILWTESAKQSENLEIYRSNFDPDAILSAWPSTRAVLTTLGLQPPIDIGYINLNIVRKEDSVSGIFQNVLEIGATAVSRLNVMLQYGEKGIPLLPDVTALSGEWYPGSTLQEIGRTGSRPGKRG